jgi:hypothetical protein
MGLQGLLVRDLLHSVRRAGREDLLMNAAGQTAGMMREIRPAGVILDEIVGRAADVLSREIPARVKASVARDTVAAS